MTEQRKFMEILFPPYRLNEGIPFGFWYAGFLGMTISFFNLSINFFSHFSLLVGYLTHTLVLSGIPRDPNGLDLFLSGMFSLYYLVSVPLFIWFSASYWNFRPGGKKRLLTLFSIDILVFCLYNVLYFTGIYLYMNHYMVPKLPLYALFAAVALYYLMGDSDTKAQQIVERRKS